MPMPEAAMHENQLFVAPKDQIRSAWKASVVQSVAVSHAMHEAADQQLRSGVTAPNLTHSDAAGCGRERIHGVAQEQLVARAIKRQCIRLGIGHSNPRSWRAGVPLAAGLRVASRSLGQVTWVITSPLGAA